MQRSVVFKDRRSLSPEARATAVAAAKAADVPAVAAQAAAAKLARAKAVTEQASKDAAASAQAASAAKDAMAAAVLAAQRQKEITANRKSRAALRPASPLPVRHPVPPPPVAAAPKPATSVPPVRGRLPQRRGRPLFPVRPATAPAAAPKPAAPAVVPVKTVGGLKRAVVIGINYVGTQYRLDGCINDAINMQAQLKTFFPTCTDYRLITDSTPMKPTRANILASIDWLVAGLKPGENVMFHYSGHGGTVRDTNGDEVTGLDSCIYPVNGRQIEMIVDDELRARLAAKIPAGSKCFVVLDCCYSGTAVDLRCLWAAPSATTLTYTENQKYAKTNGTVVFMSGCQDTQVAADTVDKQGKPCGALTMALLSTWKTYGPAIKFKYILWDVRKFLRDNGYTQIPQLSTGAAYDINTVFDLGSA